MKSKPEKTTSAQCYRVTETDPANSFSFVVFFYLLPKKKKRKCSITSHTEMYCLRKKYIYIFHIFLLFFPHFFLLFRKRFVILHQNQNFFFPFFFPNPARASAAAAVFRNPSPTLKQTNKQKKCTKKYVIHSYHFGFIN